MMYKKGQGLELSTIGLVFVLLSIVGVIIWGMLSCRSIIEEVQEEEEQEIVDVMINSNSSKITNITAMFIVDCSLPEIYENETVEIVYGEAIYGNINAIDVLFPEFCRRLESQICESEFSFTEEIIETSEAKWDGAGMINITTDIYSVGYGYQKNVTAVRYGKPEMWCAYDMSWCWIKTFYILQYFFTDIKLDNNTEEFVHYFEWCDVYPNTFQEECINHTKYDDLRINDTFTWKDYKERSVVE